MNLIRTIRQADKIARQLGIKRAAGKYNGMAYWKSANGEIVTRYFLETLALKAGLI
jgi:hypothetical protein